MENHEEKCAAALIERIKKADIEKQMIVNNINTFIPTLYESMYKDIIDTYNNCFQNVITTSRVLHVDKDFAISLVEHKEPHKFMYYNAPLNEILDEIRTTFNAEPIYIRGIEFKKTITIDEPLIFTSSSSLWFKPKFFRVTLTCDISKTEK